MAKHPKSRLWTNADLREWFDIYNRLYFGGKLECNHITYVDMFWLGKTTRLRRPGRRRSQQDSFTIKISKRFRDSRRLSIGTLVHEMVHLEDRCHYSCGLRGKHFNRRMLELAKAGAFDGIW